MSVENIHTLSFIQQIDKFQDYLSEQQSIPLLGVVPSVAKIAISALAWTAACAALIATPIVYIYNKINNNINSDFATISYMMDCLEFNGDSTYI